MAPGGRPPIGEPINVRLGAELLAEVDRKADNYGVSRAEVIRMILSDVLLTGASTAVAVRCIGTTA
jgi:metal-responsive CopG/Arc/MetJ family transcriptional regulator